MPREADDFGDFVKECAAQAAAEAMRADTLPVDYYRDKFGNYRHAPTAMEKAAEAMRAKCEAIARGLDHFEIGKQIADALAALKAK